MPCGPRIGARVWLRGDPSLTPYVRAHQKRAGGMERGARLCTFRYDGMDDDCAIARCSALSRELQSSCILVVSTSHLRLRPRDPVAMGKRGAARGAGLAERQEGETTGRGVGRAVGRGRGRGRGDARASRPPLVSGLGESASTAAHPPAVGGEPRACGSGGAPPRRWPVLPRQRPRRGLRAASPQWVRAPSILTPLPRGRARRGRTGPTAIAIGRGLPGAEPSASTGTSHLRRSSLGLWRRRPRRSFPIGTSLGGRIEGVPTCWERSTR